MAGRLSVTKNHWLRGVRRCPSPNRDARPNGEISLLVIHSISLPPGVFGGGLVDALFCNELDCHAFGLDDLVDLKVSSHLLIDRSGAATQYVPFSHRAWHAGVSSWRGRSGCNDFAIGVELEGADHVPFTAEQYTALAGISTALFAAYPRLDLGAVVGHQDIAPERKTDPGPTFDWRSLLLALSAGRRRVAHRD